MANGLWHLWFAWYPVLAMNEAGNMKLRWLVTIHRSGFFKPNGIGWEYRT